jgi:hypothetical protein
MEDSIAHKVKQGRGAGIHKRIALFVYLGEKATLSVLLSSAIRGMRRFLVNIQLGALDGCSRMMKVQDRPEATAHCIRAPMEAHLELNYLYCLKLERCLVSVRCLATSCSFEDLRIGLEWSRGSSQLTEVHVSHASRAKREGKTGYEFSIPYFLAKCLGTHWIPLA